MPAEVALPIGILTASLLLFVGGFLWARHKDHEESREKKA
jgi:hypothetical protein